MYTLQKVMPAGVKMKVFLNVLIINTMFICTTVTASEITNDYEWSTNIGTRGVFLRNSLSGKHGIFYGLSYFASKDNIASDDTTTHVYGAEIGHRYYLDKSSIHHFIDSSFMYRYQERKSDVFGDQSTKRYYLNFLYGLENFISKEFSVEGAVGIYISYSEHSELDITSSFVSIPLAKVGINYYF